MLKTIYPKKTGPFMKSIALFKFAITMLLVFSASIIGQAQSGNQFTVRGTVSSGDGTETMPGVNVLIKGTTSGTATDIDGNYSI